MFDLNAEELWEVIETVRNGSERTHRSDLVHCFMNAVAANDCANALLAVGARPVMADCAEECAEITSHAGALVLNMGTFSSERGKAMLISGRAANASHIPVIIDPVGIQASSLRQKWFARFMKELRVAAVKGNVSELYAIKEGSLIVGSGETLGAVLARHCAEQLGCTVLVTGETDFVSDGQRVFGLSNGSPHLSAVTGTGCMTGALVGAYAAVTEPIAACAAAVSIMNISGELAAVDFHGTGSFRVRLMDMLSQTDRETFISRFKMNADY